ncbi:heparan-alpha-glucosaminide N-acetyltransferase domain-containing protein [Thermus antranikianii]|uniref:heparan-alpha-glucosaminide N-acetyltransferase domain-containing protein n=1 Tax=Thermus antranikianii TaxID=88190 RepID=UPI001C740EBE|nr:DUF5009 domain-containing protein [Thermus antranikianii]QWK21467.1 MAG: DUF5009 domain-containing protein [Thermus antranikianii]
MTLSARSLALDAFRGLTVALMLFVNNLPPGAPPYLEHGPFGGSVYLADLVFPWYLLTMGAAIPFSRASALRRGVAEWLYELRILRRVVLLFLLGLGLTSLQMGRWVFALDVLQLLALAYWLGAWLYDLPLLRRTLLALFLMVAYGAAILLVPVPGVGPGIFAEDRNLLLHLNRTYLMPLGLRGLPSAIPTGAFVLLATGLGEALMKGRSLWPWGVLGLVGGLVFLPFLPPDKTYWTPTYLLPTLFLGALTLEVLKRLPRGTLRPLRPFGANPLLAYVLPLALKLTWLRGFWSLLLGTFLAHGGPAGGYLFTLSYILFWWLVFWVLDRLGLYLRL